MVMFLTKIRDSPSSISQINVAVSLLSNHSSQLLVPLHDADFEHTSKIRKFTKFEAYQLTTMRLTV